MLSELVLRRPDSPAASVEDDGAGTGRALVECENVFHRGVAANLAA